MKQEKNNPSGNLYDRIFKENAEALFIPLIEQELDIKIISYKPLQEKMTKTIEREMDFFYQVVTDENKKILLHIEFQTQNDKNMIYRMVEYHGLAFRKHKLPIKHIVIYLGKGKPSMKTKLKDEEKFEGFDLINIHELNTTQLLGSQVPEIVLLALLSNYEVERTDAILRLIVMQLKAVSKTPEELSKYLQQLIVLSRLRTLEDLTIKIIQDMPITYDIKKDALYKKGKEEGIQEGIVEGIQKGIQKGIQEGIQEGIQKTLENVAINCLKQGKSYEEIAIMTGLSISQVQDIDEKRKK
ncbi:MAG: hypothetical protein R3E32_27735 [Chitinophagales bacterium]